MAASEGMTNPHRTRGAISARMLHEPLIPEPDFSESITLPIALPPIIRLIRPIRIAMNMICRFAAAAATSACAACSVNTAPAPTPAPTVVQQPASPTVIVPRPPTDRKARNSSYECHSPMTRTRVPTGREIDQSGHKHKMPQVSKRVRRFGGCREGRQLLRVTGTHFCALPLEHLGFAAPRSQCAPTISGTAFLRSCIATRRICLHEDSTVRT